MQRSASKKRTDPFKNIGFVRINALFHKKLRFPLDVILEPDADGYIARTVDLPLYSFANDPFEALTLLKKRNRSSSRRADG